MGAKSSKEVIDEAIDKMEGEQPPEVREKLKKLNTDIYVEGMSPQEAMGLSDNMIEGMYSFAYRLYTLGRYDQAAQTFRLLIMMNPLEPRFTLGVAACYQMQKQYELAASSYILSTIADRDNPVPFFHASDCYIELGDMAQAEKTLKLCLERCKGNNPEHQAIKNRAEVALQQVQESLGKTKKEEKKAKPKAA